MYTLGKFILDHPNLTLPQIHVKLLDEMLMCCTFKDCNGDSKDATPPEKLTFAEQCALEAVARNLLNSDGMIITSWLAAYLRFHGLLPMLSIAQNIFNRATTAQEAHRLAKTSEYISEIEEDLIESEIIYVFQDGSKISVDNEDYKIIPTPSILRGKNANESE